MPLTILFDLDDTLLGNNINQFLPNYFKALCETISDAPLQKFINTLMAATGKMITNEDPSRPLEAIFDENFYPVLGVTKPDWQKKIDHFYRDVFPTLKEHTHPRPDMVRVVEYAFSRGWQVVVATNPLFPRTAIYQRLAWAGLPVEKYPFALVTSYETSHFAKPNPAYFAEILARLGWQNQPAVMVGNDFQEDIQPAVQLGLPAYWLNEGEYTVPIRLPEYCSTGRVKDLTAWLDRCEAQPVMPGWDTPAAILAQLRSTPAALNSLVLNQPLPAWQHRPTLKDWNLVQILCHMRDVDREINLPRVKEICESDNPFLPGIDSDRWAEERQYERQNGEEALLDFIETRKEMIQHLENLQAKGWDCPARHAIFGPTKIGELVGFMASHDRNHINQIYENMTHFLRGTRRTGPLVWQNQ